MENNKGASFLEMIITGVAIMIIIALVFLYYYYSIKSLTISEAINTSVPGQNMAAEKNQEFTLQQIQKQNEMATNIIYYLPIKNSNFPEKQGDCLGSSLSCPYREDIFRCKADNTTYDTCFATENAKEVICSTNPLKEKGVLIKLTKSLPKLSLPENIPDNFAWFVELEDGKFCAPFIGTLPAADNKTAYYNCYSSQKDQLDVLLGQLEKGKTWTGQRAVLIKINNSWSIQSTEKVNIKTVWQ